MATRKYRWTEGSGKRIQDWVKEVKPSKVDGATTSWIWVEGDSAASDDPEADTGSHDGALAKAYTILEQLEKRLNDIEKDDRIPIRGSKTNKSKRVVRDEAHNLAKEELKKLSIKSEWTCGKWLFFPTHFNVDKVWSEIAISVADGPLKEAGVNLAKVAPTPTGEADIDKTTHLICVYMDNVYDVAQVRKVLIVLLTRHGLEPSACKSDLYTLAGIDSNHPTKLRSTLWRPAEIIDGGIEGIKALKIQAEEYKRVEKEHAAPSGETTRRKDSRVRPNGIIDSDSEDERIVISDQRKAPPAVRSEVQQDQKQAAKAQTVSAQAASRSQPKKKQKTEAEKYKDNDIFASPSDSD